jgi:hypothetical protein
MVAAPTSSAATSSPAAERPVGGDDQAGAFRSARDELEEQFLPPAHRDVADHVDHEQLVAAEPEKPGCRLPPSPERLVL